MEPANIRASLPHPPPAYHTAGSVSTLSAFLSPALPQGSCAQFSKAFRRICAVRRLSRVQAILSQSLLCRGSSSSHLAAPPRCLLQSLCRLHVCPRRVGTQVLHLLVEVVALCLQGSAQFLQALDFHLKPLQLFIPKGFLQTEKRFRSTTVGTKAERKRDETSEGSSKTTQLPASAHNSPSLLTSSAISKRALLLLSQRERYIVVSFSSFLIFFVICRTVTERHLMSQNNAVRHVSRVLQWTPTSPGQTARSCCPEKCLLVLLQLR